LSPIQLGIQSHPIRSIYRSGGSSLRILPPSRLS
jgi:hypothetical protein